MVDRKSKAIKGYDQGYDVEVFCLGLALDPKYVEDFLEGCLERIGEDDPDRETLWRDLWKEGETEMVLDLVKSGCEDREGRPTS